MEALEETLDLAATVEAAVGALKDTFVDIEEAVGGEYPRRWSALMLGSRTRQDPARGGLVVTISLNPGELEFAARDVLSADWGRQPDEHCDRLTVLDGGEPPRFIVVAPEGALASPPPLASREVVDRRDVAQARDLLNHFWTQRPGAATVLARDEREAGPFGSLEPVVGPLRGVREDAEGFTVLVGDIEIALPFEEINGASSNVPMDIGVPAAVVVTVGDRRVFFSDT